MKLREYQKEGIDFIARRRGRALISLCPGAGKTFIVLYTRKKYPALKNILIVCPASIKNQWQREFSKVFPEDSCYVINGTVAADKIQKVMESSCVVINYDMAHKWKNVLKNRHTDLLVLDESHKVKNKDSGRTKACQEISRSCKHRVLLTGTPITNTCLDLWSQLNILDPAAFDSEAKFSSRYVYYVKKPIRVKDKKSGNYYTKEITVPCGQKHTAELNAVVRDYFFTKTEKEVYKEFPDVQDIYIPIDITNQKDYSVAERIFLKSSESDSEADANLQHARQVLGLGKVKDAITWLEDALEVNPKEKLVVFVVHRKVAEALHEHFKKKSVLYYGGMSSTEKDRAISTFISNDSCNFFIGNIVSAGTGVDGLNTVCNKCVLVEFSYVPAENEQAKGRTRRINSVFDKYIAYWLVGKDSLDERVLEVIKKKTKDANDVLNGPKITRQEMLQELLFK